MPGALDDFSPIRWKPPGLTRAVSRTSALGAHPPLVAKVAARLHRRSRDPPSQTYRAKCAGATLAHRRRGPRGDARKEPSHGRAKSLRDSTIGVVIHRPKRIEEIARRSGMIGPPVPHRAVRPRWLRPTRGRRSPWPSWPHRAGTWSTCSLPRAAHFLASSLNCHFDQLPGHVHATICVRAAEPS